jgi:PAS domain S-box-containing protein
MLGKQLLERSGFFKTLIDNMQVGVIVADDRGYIRYINKTYAKFLGIDPQDQVGRHASEMGVNSRLHIVAKTGRAEINFPHQLKDRGYLVHRVPITENGRLIAVLGMVLFDSASTASKLAEKLTFMESKLDLYENELLSLRSTRYTIESIIGVSEAIEALRQDVVKAATNHLPVIITGESGTGKELLAQAIHHASSRRSFPFVRVNCATIPRDLFESELFGYEKGAFTGARTSGKPGKFELAHHGTIFLDEIGDLPLAMQPKLLRVLEEKEFERIGGTAIIKTNFRLIAATNQDLERLLAEGRFRHDLFYRLNVISLPIPPLRERREDILPTAQHMLERIAQDIGLPPIGIESQAATLLRRYDWPGNAREIVNVLERAASYLTGDTIYIDDLPPYIRASIGNQHAKRQPSLKHIQDQAEREAIRGALAASGYNKSRAARNLGIHRSLLYKKMRKYDLPLKADTRFAGTAENQTQLPAFVIGG